jgi:hypothetical protein
MSPGILALLKGKLVMLVYKGAFFHTETKILSALQGMFPAPYPNLLTIELAAHICTP